MADLLIRKFNEFNKESFYQNIDSSIDEIINSYKAIRRDPDLSGSHKREAASERQARLGKIARSAGMASAGGAPIDLEAEFFPDGDLDESRFKRFKSSVLRHQSLEELKWIHAGTTGSYTQITRKACEKQNRSLDDLLPGELKRKSGLTEKMDGPQSSPGAYSVFAYPDGTMSSSYEPEKAQFSFDRTRDTSGVAWGSGYHPDNGVNKKDWDAGFNSHGEWERIVISGQKKYRGRIEAGLTSPLISFDPRFDKDVEFIYIIDCMDETGILCDEEGLLADEQEERYYSVAGRLYAIRKTDPEGTAEKIKQEILEKGIHHISTLIAPDSSERTRSAYKNILGDMINESTEFRAAADPALPNEMAKLRESMAERSASSEIIRRYRVLQTTGYSGEELYRGLEHESVSPVIERELSIFTSKKDLETFVAMPDIREVLDEDALSCMENLDVPESKAAPMSSSVQNLLHNFQDLFKHTSLTPKEVISRTYEVIVKENTEKASQIHIPGESTLSGYIKQQMPGNIKTTIPAFHADRKSNNAPNLFKEDSFSEWSEHLPSLITDEMANQIKQELRSSSVRESQEPEISKTIISAFRDFPLVQESTGITPAEFTREIISAVKGGDVSARGSKRVLFDKTLDRLITESSVNARNTVSVEKSAILTPGAGRSGVQMRNLFNDQEFKDFASSPEFVSYGLTGSEINELSSGLNGISIPDDLKPEFSQNLLQILPRYREDFSPEGYDIPRLLTANASYTRNIQSDDARNIARFINMSKVSAPAQAEQQDYVFAGQHQSFADRNALVKELGGASLSDIQIDNLLDRYKEEYYKYPVRNLHRVEARYQNVPVSGTAISQGDDDLSFTNLGWKTVQRPGMGPELVLLKRSQGPRSGNLPFAGKMDAVSPQNRPSLDDIRSSEEIRPDTAFDNTLSDSLMVYTTPAVKAGRRSAIQSPGNTETGARKPEQNASADDGQLSYRDLPPVDEKLVRMSDNYFNDKRMMAKNESGSGNASPGKEKGAKKKTRLLEAIYDEFIDKMQKS